MSNKTVIAVIIILIGLVAGFLYLMPFGDPEEGVLNGGGEEIVFNPGELSVDHFFADGVHTVDGTVDLPTPCHQLDHEVLVAESFPEQVSINFSTTKSDGLCTQVLTSKIFSLSFNASEEAVLSATFNGQPLRLLLNEAEGGAIQKL